MISLTYSKGKFTFTDLWGYESESLSKELKKFKFNKAEKSWVTRNPKAAFALRKYADKKAKRFFRLKFINYKRWSEGLVIPKGENLFKHQPLAVYFALNRNRSYLALSPGLGKTIVAAIISATLGKRVLYICPPSLTLNTQEEFKRWAPSLVTSVLGVDPDWIIPDVLIVPDSILERVETREYIEMFKTKVIFFDEAQRLKNPKSLRCKAFMGYSFRSKYYKGVVDSRSVERVIYLSGTPTDGRPMDIFSILNKSAPQYHDFVNQFNFGLEYCDGKKVFNHNEQTRSFGQVMGYDFTGCSEEPFKKLANRFRTFDPEDKKAFMLRQNKDLLGLPKLTETTLVLSEDMPKDLKTMNSIIVNKYSPHDLMKMKLADKVGKDSMSLHIAEYRRLLGEHKVKPAAKYYLEILEDTEEKIILSAYHSDVLKSLQEKFSKYDPLFLVGGMSTKKKTNMVKEFQTNKKVKIFIIQYVAGGLGLTLTKANREGKIEYDWGVNANRQMTDRGHRIGLKHPFLSQYCLYRNSLDAKMLKANNKKSIITTFI